MIESVSKDTGNRLWILTRLTDPIIEKYDSLQECANFEIQKAWQYDKLLSSELKGIFTEGELSLLLDISNGTMVNADFIIGQTSAMIGGIEYSFKVDNLGEKWGVDLESITAKIKSLSPALCAFLQNELNVFWHTRFGEQTISDFTARFVVKS